MSNSTLWADLPARLSHEFTANQHLLPMYLHIILAALFPIYTAAHASLSRPNSAAKPTKSTSKSTSKSMDDEDDEEKPRMEGLSPSDAILFPLTAGAALTALYFALKWDKELLNKLLGWYMSLGGLFGVVKFLSDSMHIVHSFFFPVYYSCGKSVWQVNHNDKKAYQVDGNNSETSSPLPGFLSGIPLPSFVVNALWSIRGITVNDWTFKFYIHKIIAVQSRYDLFHFIALVIGTALVYIFTFVTKSWYLTNLMGFAFSYTALQIISPTTFTTGSLVLIGLFFYDIYMVFFTPMMVTVAKNLDIPIKLLFPRPPPSTETPDKRAYSMLGLGDIVLPGIVMGLALRFDLYLHYLRLTTSSTKPQYISPSRNWSNHFWTSSRSAKSSQVPNAGQFSKTYFNASIMGYILGMVATLIAMVLSDHPQPALLYLVPGVLLSLWLTALVRGEIKLMWNFTEEEAIPVDEKKKDEKKTEKPSAEEIKKEERAGIEALEKKFFPTRKNELLFFSISHNEPNKAVDHSWVSVSNVTSNGEPSGKRQKIT